MVAGGRVWLPAHSTMHVWSDAVELAFHSRRRNVALTSGARMRCHMSERHSDSRPHRNSRGAGARAVNFQRPARTEGRCVVALPFCLCFNCFCALPVFTRPRAPGQHGAPYTLPVAPPHPRVHRPVSLHLPHRSRVLHCRHHPRPPHAHHQLLLPPHAPPVQPPLVALVQALAPEEEGRVELHRQCIRLYRAMRPLRLLLRGTHCADGRWLSPGSAPAGLATGRGKCARQQRR